MLKIKDNVDLKELEKLGFKKVTYINGDIYEFTRHRYNHNIRNVIVSTTDRILHYNIMSVHNELDDIVFDLIKANMVEKVGE